MANEKKEKEVLSDTGDIENGKKAEDGDRIIIAPGEYNEKNILLTKAITITSEWKLSGDNSIIDKTIIDSDGSKLFLIKKDGIEISGLKIINGDHTLDVTAKTTIIYNPCGY